MKAQQHWRRFEKDVAAEKVESSALVHQLKQEAASSEQKWQAEADKAQAASVQARQQAEAAQAAAAETSKELANLQDALKVEIQASHTADTTFSTKGGSRKHFVRSIGSQLLGKYCIL